MRWISASLAALFVMGIVGVVTAQETITVRVEGMGSDPDGALKNAFTRAIQEAVGIFVDSEAIVSNDKLQEEILTYSDGVVTRFTVVKEATRDMNLGGLFRVEIDAVVETKELNRRLKASGVLSSTVSGEDQWAKLVSQIKNVKDGRKLLKKFFDDYPQQSLIVAHAMDDLGRQGSDKQFAQVYDPKTDQVTLTINFDISIDVEAFYTQYVPKLVALLEAISIEKNEGIIKSSKSEREKSAITLKPLFYHEAFENAGCKNTFDDSGRTSFNVVVAVGHDENRNHINIRYRCFQLRKIEYEDLFAHFNTNHFELNIKLLTADNRILKTKQIPFGKLQNSLTWNMRNMRGLLRPRTISKENWDDSPNKYTVHNYPIVPNIILPTTNYSTADITFIPRVRYNIFSSFDEFMHGDSMTAGVRVEVSETEVRQLQRIDIEVITKMYEKCVKACIDNGVSEGVCENTCKSVTGGK